MLRKRFQRYLPDHDSVAIGLLLPALILATVGYFAVLGAWRLYVLAVWPGMPVDGAGHDVSVGLSAQR